MNSRVYFNLFAVLCFALSSAFCASGCCDPDDRAESRRAPEVAEAANWAPRTTVIYVTALSAEGKALDACDEAFGLMLGDRAGTWHEAYPYTFEACSDGRAVYEIPAGEWQVWFLDWRTGVQGEVVYPSQTDRELHVVIRTRQTYQHNPTPGEW